MSTAQIKNLMAEMKQNGMAAMLEDTIALATQNQWSYSEFLDVLLQAEFDYRRVRKSQRRISDAKFKIRAVFEDWDHSVSRSITKAQIKEISNLKWMEQGRPLLLIGQTGVGKTFIAQAAGLHACNHGHAVLFMTITTWLENLKLARATGAYLKYRDKLAKPDILIIDDFGMRKLDAMEAQDFCEILEERSMGKSTIITTQLPIDHWHEVLPDPVIADAIIDRVKHAAITFKIVGPTYRKTKAEKLDSPPESK